MALFVLTAAGLVLLVACANLAGLLTAFVGARKHEMAVRAAIGAGRLRLVRQLMTESALLAVAGGTVGLLLAQWGVDLFAGTLGKPQGAEWIEFGVDGRVVMFAIAASVVTALLFGLAPAIGGARVDLRSGLAGRQQGGRCRAPRASRSQCPRRRTGGLVDCPRLRGRSYRDELAAIRRPRRRVQTRGTARLESRARGTRLRPA